MLLVSKVLVSTAKNEQNILLKVAQGNTFAFRELVDRYKHMVYTIAINIVKNNEDAEEVVQDSFVKVFNNITQFKAESKFSSWLYKIVYNTALSKIRRKIPQNVSLEASEVEPYLDASSHLGWETILLEDKKHFITKALNLLSEKDKIVLTLFYLAEEPINEIALITGDRPGTIKARLHRARTKLYSAMTKLLKNEVSVLL